MFKLQLTRPSEKEESVFLHEEISYNSANNSVCVCVSQSVYIIQHVFLETQPYPMVRSFSLSSFRNRRKGGEEVPSVGRRPGHWLLPVEREE